MVCGEGGHPRAFVANEVTASPPPRPLRKRSGEPIASPWTVDAAVAIAEAVFSRSGSAPPAERLAWFRVEMEDFLANAGGNGRFFLSLTIWTVTLLAPLLAGRFGLLGSLALAERVRALSTLEHRFAEPLLAVKAILCLIWYEQPEVLREVGFDRQCLVVRPGSGPSDGKRHLS